MSDSMSDLADPAISLRLYGQVADQAEDMPVLYDPHRITTDLQQTILAYVSDPPLTPDGYTMWLDMLKYRQGGSSTASALALYPKVAYNSGYNAVIIADTHDRADELFRRVEFCHSRWPEDIRVKRLASVEHRSLTTNIGSQMVVKSANKGPVGIGASISALLASELPYWPDAGYQFSLIGPAMRNKRFALRIRESTPAPLSEPSAQWWMDEFEESTDQLGRSISAFFPFWDGKLNRRQWPIGQAMTNEEIRLMEKFSAKGLTLDNLQFRRFTMEDDKEIRRDPDLFGVYYPFDMVSCWRNNGSGVISDRFLSKYESDIIQDHDGLNVYEEPVADALYLIAGDPAGFGARDHAAFQVLKVYADSWEQVASYGQVTTPDDFAQLLFDTGKHYNMARMCIERNGVGMGAITLLGQKGMKYPNMHYDAALKAGVHKANNDQWIGILLDALMDKLVLRGSKTINQLRSYRNDKLIERTAKSELLAGGRGGGQRRGRHHWDLVSALMVACACAPFMPIRHKPKPQPDNVRLFKDLTWDEIQAYERKVKAMMPKPSTGGRRARYTRRKG